MIEPTYDAGVCTVVDVKNTNDVEWMKTCKLFGKKDYVFMSKGIVEKYRIDMAALYDTYEQLKGLAAQLPALTKDFVLLPVDEGLPSLVDMAICYIAFMPCSASCMPIKPCKTVVRDGMNRWIKHHNDQNMKDADCQVSAEDIGIKIFLPLLGFEELVVRFLNDFIRGVSESCESSFKYLLEDTNIDAFASSRCASISNYTTAYNLDHTFEDGKCTENVYLQAKRIFDKKKKSREKSINDWETRALISIFVAYGILLIAAIMILAKFIARKKKVSAITDFIVKHNTPASVVCSCIAFAFGICILAISLGYFLWLKDSVFYVYAFLSVGLCAIYAAFRKLLLAPLEVNADKSAIVNASKFQRCIAYATYLRAMYSKKVGVAGDWFLHAAIIRELAEVLIQARGLFRYASSQDALITAATCSTLALNCLLSPYGYVRQRRDVVIACDGICDILYTVISATRIVALDAPISFLDALLLLFPTISIIGILNSYAAFSIKAKSCDKSRGISRGISGLLRLPPRDFSQSNSAQKIYKFLLSLFIVSACAICSVSGYTLVRCVSQHLACRERYSSCLWRSAWPREYLQQGIFGDMTCGEDHVRKIDAATCVHSKADMQSIDFEKFSNLTTLRLGNVSFFPSSLISLMQYEAGKAKSSSLIATFETLPVTLDFSNQGIGNFPELMKDIFSAYEKTNVQSLNISGNALDSPTLLEWLNAIIPCSKDGSRGFCNLHTVDVSRNVLSDIPFVGLGNAQFPKLSNIIARENNIYKINAQTAEWALKESATIDIGNNKISDITLSALDLGGRDFESLLGSLSEVGSLDNVTLVSLLTVTGLEGGFSGIINGSLGLQS